MIASAALQANQAEFDFQAGPHPVGELAVVGFEAEEVLSQPYSVQVPWPRPRTCPWTRRSCWDRTRC